MRRQTPQGTSTPEWFDQRSAELVLAWGVEGGGDKLFRSRGPRGELVFVSERNEVGLFDLLPEELDGPATSTRRRGGFEEYWHEIFGQMSILQTTGLYVHEDFKRFVLGKLRFACWSECPDDSLFPVDMMWDHALRSWGNAVDYARLMRPDLPGTVRIDFLRLVGRTAVKSADLNLDQVESVQSLLDCVYNYMPHGLVRPGSYTRSWSLLNLRTGSHVKKGRYPTSAFASDGDVLQVQLRD